MQSGAAQVRALEQAIASSQSSLDSTKLDREVGVRTTLNALQQYFSTKRDLASARYSYLLNRLRLAQAAGELEARGLANAELRQ